jgi:uncharacterized damage-inducible protein DinB
MHYDTFRHMQWADAEVWRAVFAIEGKVDDRMRGLLHHLHRVQRGFLSVWRGETPDLREHTSFATLEDLRDWGRQYYSGAEAFIQALDADALQRPVNMPWAPPESTAPTLADTLIQIPMHSAYHRGQVNARVRELGGEPPFVDYIFWIWRGKPSAQW